MPGKLIYEGKAKSIYETDHPYEVQIYFRDDATAFNGEKKGQINSKGILNNAISSLFFELLDSRGVPSHFIRKIDDRSMLAKRIKIIPIEVVVRNIAAGSLSQRLGLPEGQVLPRAVVEFYYKDDKLGDPLINNSHVDVLGLATPAELEFLSARSLKINDILKDYLAERKVRLVDFKLEYGKSDQEILLGDEISPDTCRFWDADTNQKLDKDRFRRDLGGVEEAYQEMYDRLKG
ncbi:MAG: phosphoribosylaminoimidazolesuccinocarboxamide synthase [Deltaproteobacteria bacterium]|jgi:phosphoribosylaminoimidazole-succinocarboxamide synthase|nr:phosphoribosylaminoimidazolesuccinocarboxamide synthase [Deltaproteobacteria bacterium]MDR1298594.1 phosphoribosylaminoimidazolesuccinocarboxamide synthase [Deltaproteobacteria bacterium]